mgnify:CR=1 FL=1
MTKQKSEMMQDRERVYSRIPTDMVEDIDALRERFGVNKSAMVGMCIGIGLNYLKALINPEGLLSSKKMAEVLMESEKLGVEFKKPDELD